MPRELSLTVAPLAARPDVLAVLVSLIVQDFLKDSAAANLRRAAVSHPKDAHPLPPAGRSPRSCFGTRQTIAEAFRFFLAACGSTTAIDPSPAYPVRDE